MIGKEEKDKGKERIHPLHSTEEVGSSGDDMPALIAEEAFIKTALQAYYQSQSTFRQGLSERQESITQSFINLSIISRDLQQQKEEVLAQQDQSLKEQPQDNEPTQTKTETKEASLHDERLASYEALRTNPKPIALEDLFKQDVSSLQPNQRLLVLGRAGIGKTTLSQHISYRWAINDLWPEFSYVFWLPLRNLNQSHFQTVSNLNLAMLIEQECLKMATESAISIAAIEGLLKHETAKTLLILDGYDEVAYLLNSESCLNQVLQQALAFPQLIVTSRPYAVPDSQSFDCSLEVMGFTEANILTYVANYFNHSEAKLPQEVKPLQQFLKTNPNIWGTAHVPINLALICNAWEEAKDKGETLNVRLTMTGLYHNLVQALLKRAVIRQGKFIYEASPQWLDQQNKRATQVLAALAAHGLAQQQIILSTGLQQQVFASLNLNAGEAQQALSEAVSLGLLQPITNNQTLATFYYFIHLTFQEFFTARYYVHGLQKASDSEVHQQTLTFIREHKYNSFYQLVFWFMAGLVSASEKARPLILFWQTLLDEPHDVMSFAHLRVLIHCLDEAQVDSRIPQKDNLLRYLGQALEAVVLGRKAGLITQFREYWRWDNETYDLEKSFHQFLFSELNHTSFLTQDPLFFNQLVRHLKQNKDVDAIEKAIETLGNLTNFSPAVIDLLVKRAGQGEKAWVRQAALKALGKLSNPSPVVIDLFVERAGHDEDYYGGRKAVIKVLSKLSNPSSAVIGLLCEWTGQDEEDWVRRAAIKALGNLTHLPPEVIDLLCERAEQDEKAWIRQTAIKALSKLTHPSPAVIGLLCERAVQDSNNEVRQTAINAFDKLSNPSPAVIDLFIKMAGQDKELWVRRAAIKALSKLTNFSPSVIDLLCERAMRSKNYEVKRAAIYALSKLSNPSPAVIDLFVEMAGQYKELWVRRVAIEALGEISNLSSAGIDLLIERAGQDKCYQVRRVAIEALGKLSNLSSAGIDLLYERAKQDEYYEVRRAAIEALGKLGNSSPVVIGLLCEWTGQDEENWVRQAAINALGELVNPSSAVIALLVKRAGQSKNDKVRQAIIKALVRLSNPSSPVIELLVKWAAHDKDYSVKRAAIEALCKLSNPSSAVIDLFVELAEQNKEEWVRRAVIKALSKLSNPSSAVIDLFVELAEQNKEEWVRRAAIEALGKLSNPSSAVIDLFVELAEQNKEEWVRRAAIEALGKLSNSSSSLVDLLVKWAEQNKEEWVRRAVIEALSKLTHPPARVIDLLVEWAEQNKNYYVKGDAIDALIKFANRSPLVIHLLCGRAVQVEVMSYVSPNRLLEARFHHSNQALGPLLASCIAKSMMRQQASLTISEDKLILYTHQPVVFELLPQHKPQLVKALLNACQTLRQEYRLPAVIGLNKLPIALIEESMLRAQEEKITFLSFKGQELHDDQVNRLVELMKIYPALRFLDLSDNAISDTGTLYLAKALANTQYLTELNLAHNQITNVGAQALLQALAGSTGLGKSRLFASTVSVTKPNSTLCFLALEGNAKVNPQTIAALNQHLNRNRQLAQASQRLLKGIKRNDLTTMKQALKAGALLTATTSKDHGPLHAAVYYGHKDAVQYLLTKYPACLNLLNRDGLSAFYFACVKGQWDLVRYLLQKGVDVNVRDYQGRSVIHHASLNSEADVLKYLLFDSQVKQLININLTDNEGQTPLHYAVLAQNERGVRLLLKAGANPSLTNLQGKTPLMMVSEFNNTRLIGYLNNATLCQSSSASSSAAALPALNPNHWVKVYFWLSQLTQGSLGHIALETAYFYASFWPQKYRLQDGLKPVASMFAESLEEDIHAEQFRKPQVYCFYSLDNQEINAEFARFCNQPRQWALTGRKLSSNTQNCSGLVYDLLSAGGIDKLVSVDWLTNALPLPNALGELIQKAERAERKQYPITTTYTPTPSLRAQQQVSVKSQEEGQFIVTLVNQLTTKLDEQTELHQEHWKNEGLARQAQTLDIKGEILRLRQDVNTVLNFFPRAAPAEVSTSGAASESRSSSDEEPVLGPP